MVYNGYKIESNQFSNKVIKNTGKGALAWDLRGMYTSDKEAMLAIDRHVVKKGAKKNVKVKTSNTSNKV